MQSNVMGVLYDGSLEPTQYWQEVCAMANELLSESPLREWTIILRSKSPDSDEVRLTRGPVERDPWDAFYSDADRGAMELTIGVPAESEVADEDDPGDLAAYIVLDLLEQIAN